MKIRAVVRAAGAAVAGWGLASVGMAQFLIVPKEPVLPGATVAGAVVNDTADFLGLPAGCEVRIVRPGGELVSAPLLPGSACDAVQVILPLELANFSFEAPDEPGDYVVVLPYGEHAVAPLRVAVERSEAPVQTLHLLPADLEVPQEAHAVDFASRGKTPWRIANSGRAPHTLGAGDRIELYAPGSTSVIAMTELEGITVPSGKAVPFELPVAGLVPGPYSLEMFAVDPGTGAIERSRAGIRARGSRVDLHMQAGHALRPGAPLRMALAVQGFPPGGPAPLYALLVGLDPGVTVLPGAVLPLVPDLLVHLSLENGLGGLLQNHLGTVTNVSLPPFFDGVAEGITLAHPRLAALSGLDVRVAALVFDLPLTTIGASQPEVVRIE
jgi:hypothetical protein